MAKERVEKAPILSFPEDFEVISPHLNDIDATAVIVLKEFQAELARAGTEMRLARMKTSVMAVIQRSPLYAAIPPEHYYLTVQDAVDAYLAEFR